MFESKDQLTDPYRWAPSKVVQAAGKLVELKNNKDPWLVIESIIDIWRSTRPKEYKSYILNLEEVKQTRKVTNVGGSQFSGVSKDKKSGGILRYTLDIPEKVVYMIRRIYTPTELPMDKKFYQKWARKFPEMVVSKKV